MTSEPVAPEYLAARRALLDVLEVLESQRPGLILVGAQAVYLRAPAEDSQRATYTTDGDLAIDPDLLAHEPDIGRVLVPVTGVSSCPVRVASPRAAQPDLRLPFSTRSRFSSAHSRIPTLEQSSFAWQVQPRSLWPNSSSWRSVSPTHVAIA